MAETTAVSDPQKQMFTLPEQIPRSADNLTIFLSSYCRVPCPHPADAPAAGVSSGCTISLTSGVLNGNNLLWRMRFLHRCYFLLDVVR